MAKTGSKSKDGPRDLIQVIQALGRAPSSMGIRLIDRRFKESFVSYRDFHGRILQHAARFAAQGVKPGARVVVTLGTDLDLIGGFLGLIYLGAVPVSVSPPLAGQEPKAYLPQLGELMQRFEIERAVLWQSLRGAAAETKGFDAGRLLEHQLPTGAAATPADPPAAAVVVPDDLAYVQFSSGSTAKPKGVRITHQNVVYNLAWAVGDAPREAGHTGLTWLPLYHDMGLVGGFLSNLLLPNAVVLMHTLCFLMKPVSWLEAITRFKVDGTNCPNFALDVCAWRIKDKDLDRRLIDLQSWKYLGLGAEPIRPASVDRFVKRFKPFGFDPLAVHPGYGMAEATLMATSISYREGLSVRRVDGAKAVSVGRPVGDTELKILDAEGRRLGAGRVGEVVLRGTSVSPGYLDAPEDTADSFRDGWFHTGDLGAVDDDGELYITGRLKDLIIVSGRNFYGHQIANLVEELPAVAKGKVFVFGVEQDDREGVVVLAVPARRPPAQMSRRAELVALSLGLPGAAGRAVGWVLAVLGTLAGRFRRLEEPEIERRIRAHLMKELGLALDDVLLVSSIPKTTSGKVKRDACEKLYQDARRSVNTLPR